MSNKRITDEQIDEFLSEVKSGLSISDEDMAAASDAASLRHDDGSDLHASRTRRTHEPAAMPWLIPFCAVVAAALLGGAWLHFSRGNELEAMERELAALREQRSAANDTDLLRLELDRLQARVEGLTTRVDIIRDHGVDIKSLQRAVAGHKRALHTLAARADEPEQASSSVDRPESAQDTTPRPQAAQASGPAEGGTWTVNLVTVAEPASVERIGKRLEELGIELRVDRVEIDNRSLKRLAVPGFGSHDEARKTATRLKEQLGLPEDPWISRE